MPPRKKQTDGDATPAKPSRRKATTPPAEDGAAVTKKPRAASTNRGTFNQDLVIVESPSKAKTINKYLGNTFKVLASYGHVRDLPRRRKKGEIVAGVDIEGGWVPTYVVVEREEGKSKGRRTAKDILAELKKEANKSNRVFLATDPDREGEAIAWHIEQALGLDDATTYRVAFNEITRPAIQAAMANPGKIDMHRVQAQEARRMLDRVVGYPLSGLLGKKVAIGSSAGRVQSVALRLVVDREREIEAFKTEEYWKLTALLAPSGTVSLPGYPKALSVHKAGAEVPEADEDDNEAKPRKKAKAQEVPEGTYQAELAEWNAAKFEPANEADAMAVANALDTAHYAVSKLEQKDRAERAPPPYITSTLQQQAHIRLHFAASRTMQTAQRLYEGVDLGAEGAVALITYMRTDSTRVSNEALGAVRSHIQAAFGDAYLPEKANYFTSGKSAQEAHEAIRPTDVAYTPERVARLGLSGDQLRLYTLIWQRFVASQMKPAIFAVTNVEVTATAAKADAKGLLRAQGKVMKFDGYRRVLTGGGGKQDDAEIPNVAVGQRQDRLDLAASQHFTKPPPRFNEASLVKALEKEGIGRPSTYATIISKITSADRAYVEVRERRFHATDIGKTVTDLLVEHFPRVMDLKFTSHMEEELDEVEIDKRKSRDVLDEFWGPFSLALTAAEEKMPTKRGQETGEMCPKCGEPLVRNYSKKTKREFVGCSGFKKTGCKYFKPGEGEEAREEPVVTEHLCPSCGKPMLLRTSRKAGKGGGGQFLGCSGYPECKTTMNMGDDGKPVVSAQATEYTCEKCGKPMVIRTGRRGPFLACTGYPTCKNAKDVDAEGKPVVQPEIALKCEKCNSPMALRKGPRGPFLGCTAYPKCRNYKQVTAELRKELNLPDPPPKKVVPAVTITETCPNCDGPMKLREGKKGWFLGCAKYPKCKGVMEAPAHVLEEVAAAAS